MDGIPVWYTILISGYLLYNRKVFLLHNKPPAGGVLRAKEVWLLKQPRFGARVRRAGFFILINLTGGRNMGIIKAVTTAIGGSLADQWLEVIESGNMGDQTVFTSGVKIRRGSNTKGTDNTISDGSVIHVYPNQFMILVDGGKIIDYTAEEGYYTVKNSSLPSLFNGQFGEALKESFDRVRFGGELLRLRRSISSTCRRSRESSSEPRIRLTILTSFTMQNCFCVPMVRTRSR